jgi:hypothetical protein
MNPNHKQTGTVDKTPSPGRTAKLKHSPWTAERDRKKKRHGEAPSSIAEDAAFEIFLQGHWQQVKASSCPA